MHFSRILLFVLILPMHLVAQVITFGIDWTPPVSRQDINTDLDFYKSAGISIIQIEGIQDDVIINAITERGFQLWVSSGIKFVRKYDLKRSSETIATNITDPLYYYRSKGIHIDRYTAFENPQFSDDLFAFWSVVNDQIPRIYDGIVDIKLSTSVDLSDLNISHVSFSVLRWPVETGRLAANSPLFLSEPILDDNSARRLRVIINDVAQLATPLIMSSHYFGTLVKNDPKILTIIRSYSQNSENIVALPSSNQSSKSSSNLVFALLLVWTILFIIIKSSGSYFRSVTRYYLTHNFYIDDVMMRRTKLGAETALSIFISIVFATLVLTGYKAIAVTGIIEDIISFHYPTSWELFSTNSVIAFLFIVGGIVCIQLIGIIWLFSSTFGTVRFSHILQIYFIPQQLVVVAATIYILLHFNDFLSPFWLNALPITCFLLLVLSPIFASFDIAEYIGSGRIRFWIFGPALYLTALLAITYWLYRGTAIFDTIALFRQYGLM